MRYYIAACCNTDFEEMNYKESGNEAELFGRYPEIKEVINRHEIRSIGITFENGDRLRIYDVEKSRVKLSNLESYPSTKRQFQPYPPKAQMDE